MIIKLVLGLTIFFVVVVTNTRCEDYYRDEKGNIYTIGQWGERRYGGGGYFSKDHKNFRVDAENILKFGWKLFKNIDNPNFVFSPLSPQFLLSALTKETNNKSESYKELKNNVRYKDSKDLEDLINHMLKEGTARDLKIANAFFMKQEPKAKKSFFDPDAFDAREDLVTSEFLDVRSGGGRKSEAVQEPLQKPHRPLDVVYVDFKRPKKAKETCKKWIDTATKGVIKNFDVEVNRDTEMILASTIYFKGQWLFSFNATEKIDFEGVGPVDAMRIRKKYHSGTFSDLPAKWAAIPYNSTEAFVIVLPNEGENIDELIANMTGTEMTEIIDDLAGYPTSNWLNITIPKFKINSKIDLKEPLEKMGIRKIFTPESELYLYEDGEKPLRIASATQQSQLEIDETGSIGASATAFSVVALTIQRETEDSDFVVNRPFIAVIIDRKYGVPYFIGKITDPTLRN